MGTGSAAAVVALIFACFAVFGFLASRLTPPALSLVAAARCRGRARPCGKADQALLWFRGVTAVYCAVILGLAVANGVSKGFMFCFFTVWSWTLLILYFATASLASGLFLRRGACSELEAELTDAALGPLAHRRLARLCQVLLSTLAASALMLDVVLWGVLYQADKSPTHQTELNFVSYHMHGLNLVLVAVELCVGSLTIRAADLVIALFWPLLYSAFTIFRVAMSSSRTCITTYDDDICAWGLQDAQGGKVVWPYFFMDTSKPTAVIWYSGLALLFAMAYGGVLLFVRCTKRNRGPTAHAQARELM